MTQRKKIPVASEPLPEVPERETALQNLVVQHHGEPMFIVRASHEFSVHLMSCNAALYELQSTLYLKANETTRAFDASRQQKEAAKIRDRFAAYRQQHGLPLFDVYSTQGVSAENDQNRVERLSLLFLLLYRFIRFAADSGDQRELWSEKTAPYLVGRLPVDALLVSRAQQCAGKKIEAYYAGGCQDELFTPAQWKQEFADTDFSHLYGLLIGFAAWIAPSKPLILVREYLGEELEIFGDPTESQTVFDAMNAAPSELTRLIP